MNSVDFFKLQSKNLYRDFKTQYFDGEIFRYKPRFFDDIDGIIISFDIDEENVSLMKVQHIIAKISGFESWHDLIHSSEERKELGKLLLENREDINYGDDWDMYISCFPTEIRDIDDNAYLDLFKAVFLG